MVAVDRRPNLHLALDVDQTLGGADLVPVHMSMYNQRLGLGMSVFDVAATVQYPRTFDVPQIIAAREQDEAAFQKVREEIRTSQQIHLDFATLPGSVRGVKKLLSTRVADVSYYTVRPPEVENATKQWLANNEFPNPDAVTICASHEDKLAKIAQDHLQGDPNKAVILVDDNLQKLADAATAMTQGNPERRHQFENLVLVGFGVTRENARLEETWYLKSGLRTLALPSWEIPDMLQLVQDIHLKLNGLGTKT